MRAQTIGDRVKVARLAKGWSVAKLARESELTETSVYRIENGERQKPRADSLAALARALGVTSDELLGLPVVLAAAEPAGPFVLLPVLGTVTAGEGGIADEQIEDYRHVPATFIPPGGEESTFLVEAEGESMVDAGIQAGDLLLVCTSVPVNDGDVAVVEVDGEAFVKRVYRRNDKLLLVSDNPEFAPLEVDEARLVGRVMKSIRDH